FESLLLTSSEGFICHCLRDRTPTRIDEERNKMTATRAVTSARRKYSTESVEPKILLNMGTIRTIMSLARPEDMRLKKTISSVVNPTKWRVVVTKIFFTPISFVRFLSTSKKRLMELKLAMKRITAQTIPTMVMKSRFLVLMKSTLLSVLK